MIPLPNPFEFSSAPNIADAAAAPLQPPAPGAAAVVVSESAGPPASAAFPDTQYIPEFFSAYAARRCKDVISPPIPKAERDIDSLALNAVGAALNIHPRDLDDDSPLFLRKPRPAFLRALFQLGGTP